MRTKLNQQKRQHRERGQLTGRSRLGLLEKHKDYVKRAKDYHSKEDRIKKLREKAATRNKDEFYFGMIRSRTEKGVHIQDRGNDPMPIDVVKLLKTQDVGYVRTLLSAEEKLIDRLRNTLGASVGLMQDEQYDGDMDSEEEMMDSDDDDDLGEGTSKAAILDLLGSQQKQQGGKASKNNSNQGQKTYFVDSAQALQTFRPKKHALPVSPKSSSKGKGKASEADLLSAKEAAASLSKERKAYISALASELQARLERLSLLQRTFREMQVQRSVMGKGSKSVIGDKSKGLSREHERLNEQDLDELELKRLGKTKRKLPEPGKGVSTGARVWKWKAERRR